MKRRSWIPVLAFPLSALSFAAAAVGFVGPEARRAEPPTIPAHIANPTLQQSIDTLIARTNAVPGDYVAWATLGIAYVREANATATTRFYGEAEDALRRSLKLNTADNYVAHGGMAALAAGRHRFKTARTWAQRGVTINPHNAALYGILVDAEVQTGHYDAAIAAAQKMLDLSPDTASFARVSYLWELRGNHGLAREYMQRALDTAANPGDQAFARYYLAELAFSSGDTADAVRLHAAALQASPAALSSLEGKAKGEAALGNTEQALSDYRRVLDKLPQPEYYLQYGELLQSVGRHAAARAQYRRFLQQQQSFVDNGGAPADIDITLFHADHGDKRLALHLGRRAVAARPFVETHDAYAWALHVNGRDAEALQHSDRAIALGTRNATIYYHRGVIEKALGNFDAARADLTTALSINPSFNPLAAPLAKAALAEITNRGSA